MSTVRTPPARSAHGPDHLRIELERGEEGPISPSAATAPPRARATSVSSSPSPISPASKRRDRRLTALSPWSSAPKASGSSASARQKARCESLTLEVRTPPKSISRAEAMS
jgi:hypothetical protein